MSLFREGQTHSVKKAKAAINYDTPFSGYSRRSHRPPAAGGLRLTLDFAVRPDLLLPGRAYVRNKPRIGSLVVLVIAASLAEAQAAVDRSADLVRVAIVLPVILPPTDLT